MLRKGGREEQPSKPGGYGGGGFDEAQNLGHVWVALLHEADVLRTRGGARITLVTAFEFVEGTIWPHFGRPQIASTSGFSLSLSTTVPVHENGSPDILPGPWSHVCNSRSRGRGEKPIASAHQVHETAFSSTGRGERPS